jgi:hypothetical protein
MAAEVWTAVIGGVTGLASGAVGSLLAIGPERRLPHGQRSTASPVCCSKDHLPTSAADIEFSLSQVLDLIARGLMKGA